MTQSKPEEPEPANPRAAPPEPPTEGGAEPSREDWEKSYRYLLADFDNYRKRVEKEREAAVRQSQGRLLLRIIDLHEGIERVASALPKEAVSIREGLQMLLKNLDSLLKEESVEPLAQVGNPFQIDLHEAVGKAPAIPEMKEGSVAVIVQQGYRGPAGLLRPAKVLVAAPSVPVVTGAKEEPAED